MSRTVLARTALFLLLGITIQVSPGYSDPAPAKIRVGVIAPLSGPAAPWGDHLRKGALLGKESLPPEVSSQIELVFEDDQMKAANSAMAYRKLTESSLSALIVFSSPAAGAVVPLAEKDKIPTFVLTASTSFTDGREFAMQHFITSIEQCKVLVPEIIRRKFKTVAIVSTVHESMSDAIGKCRAHPDAGKIQFLPAKEFQPGEADFRTVVAALNQAKPDAILVGLFSPSLSAFVRQLRESGATVPIFGFANFENSAEMKSAGASADGAFFSGPNVTKDFFERYHEKYGEYPELPSGNGYDTVRLLGEALGAGAGTSREITAYVHSVKEFKGGMGTYGASQNSFAVPAKLKVIQSGGFKDVP